MEPRDWGAALTWEGGMEHCRLVGSECLDMEPKGLD